MHRCSISVFTFASSARTPIHATTTHNNHKPILTVRLLVPCAGTRTTELLGLTSPVVGNKQCAVELNKGLLQGVLLVLIDVFLVVSDDALGDGLTDGIDLRGMTTTGNANADVDFGEAVEAEDEEGFVDLVKCFVSLSFVRRYWR